MTRITYKKSYIIYSTLGDGNLKIETVYIIGLLVENNISITEFVHNRHTQNE